MSTSQALTEGIQRPRLKLDSVGFIVSERSPAQETEAIATLSCVVGDRALTPLKLIFVLVGYQGIYRDLVKDYTESFNIISS